MVCGGIGTNTWHRYDLLIPHLSPLVVAMQILNECKKENVLKCISRLHLVKSYLNTNKVSSIKCFSNKSQRYLINISLLKKSNGLLDFKHKNYPPIYFIKEKKIYWPHLLRLKKDLYKTKFSTKIKHDNQFIYVALFHRNCYLKIHHSGGF